MRPDAWPQHCRAALIRAVRTAAAQFPGPGEEAPKRVHDVRKTLKEARAIARLFLHCLGEPARVTMTALAATRRQVGRARDLDVMALRLERLAPPLEVVEPLKAAILREREAAQRARRGLSATAPRARLGAIKKRLEGWDLTEIGTAEIVAAVARTYRQARWRGRDGFESDDPVALHAFRARVVDLRYQLALLACAWPEALNAQAEALDELREALGDHHDLHVLSGFAAERGGLKPEAMQALTARVATRQKKLRRRAKGEFERLFAETSGAFAARLAAYLARPVTKPTTEEDHAGDRDAAGSRGPKTGLSGYSDR
jgi:CHAD domain-containing protein